MLLELAQSSAGVAIGAVGALAWSTRRHRTPTPLAPSLAQLGRQLAAPDLTDRLLAVAGLEQHGVDNPADCQVVIDLLCEHLRTVPAPPAGPDSSHRAAQRVFRMRLNTSYDRDCWAPLNLDLSGAHVHDLELSGCMLGELVCRDTQFHGTTRVTDAVINRGVCLEARSSQATQSSAAPSSVGRSGCLRLPGAVEPISTASAMRLSPRLQIVAGDEGVERA